jgi:MFS superfamily sulfate permease-like transporter
MNDSSSNAVKESSYLRWLPGLVTFRRYETAWLTHDFVAGIVLATMLAPVGIAYAVASGVGAIYGLYATISCLLAYALFGPSRILSRVERLIQRLGFSDSLI